MPIGATRTLLKGALDGSLNAANMRIDENFGLEVPISVPGVDNVLLRPRDTWADKSAYDAAARDLVVKFIANFEKFETHVDDNVRGAAPTAA